MGNQQNQPPAFRLSSSPRLPHGVETGPDRRADGQICSVSLTRETVRIDRNLHGIAMRVAVPVRSYRGVALSLQSGRDGALFYKLQLVHDDGELSVALDEAADDRDIIADWRLWTRFFRLPALVERQEGMIEPAETALGPVLLGPHGGARRSPQAMLKRRPRFLRRRKAGKPEERPVIHSDERELIARR